MEASFSRSKMRRRYLIQESVLILLLGYVLLLGGTFNGLVLYRLNLINTLLVAAVGLLWIGWRIVRRRPLPRTALDYPLIALLAVYGVSTVFSIDPRRGVYFTLQMLLYVGIFYLFVDLLRSGWPVELFIKVLLILGAFILFFGVWELVRWYGEWLSIGGWANPIPPAGTRVRAFLGHPNFVAAFLNLLLPFALVYALRRGLGRRILCGMWMLCALVLVFFTSSRGGWLGTVAALGSFGGLWLLDHRSVVTHTWTWLCRRRWRLVVLATIVAALIIVAGLLLIWQVQHPSHGGAVESRRWIWSAAWQALRDDPLTGIGPFTFGSQMTRLYSIPPKMLLAHAHSYAFNTAAETGLPGFLVLLWAAAVLVSVASRCLRSLAGDRRLVMVGVIAALLGCAVHSCFETPQTMPTICVIIAILLAILIKDDRPGARLSPRIGNGLLLASWLLITGGGLWMLRAYAPFTQGVLAANLGQWQAAVVQLDRAAQLDPANAFFHLQAGYAHGHLALDMGDRQALERALAEYEIGVALEPNFCTNWANLGVLRWANGDEVGAIAALQKAVDLSDESAFKLTLGRMYETIGDEKDARAMYTAALQSRPFWAESYFFRATPLRAELRREWLAEHHRDLLPPDADLAAGWEALADGEPAKAQRYFERALGGTNAYRGLGLAYLAQEEWILAEQALRTARFVPSASSWDSSRSGIALGKLAAARGDCAQAVVEYERALDELRHVTSFGPGTMGLSDYGWYIFHRESIMPDLLPGVDYISFTDDAVQALVDLKVCYEVLDEPEAALRVQVEILRVAPDYDFGP